MAYKRIIIGDQEVKIPTFSIGTLPILEYCLFIWLATGVYTVGSDSRRNLKIWKSFGVTQSGLNYHLPFPEKVQTPKVTEVKSEIGFRTVAKNQYRTIQQESLMLLEMRT